MRLTVVMANRTALEAQTGADLIYFNEQYGAFVFVQYKAMRKEGDESVFRWRTDPSDDLVREIARMTSPTVVAHDARLDVRYQLEGRGRPMNGARARRRVLAAPPPIRLASIAAGGGLAVSASLGPRRIMARSFGPRGRASPLANDDGAGIISAGAAGAGGKCRSSTWARTASRFTMPGRPTAPMLSARTPKNFTRLFRLAWRRSNTSILNIL
jgi:hypothetical protein